MVKVRTHNVRGIHHSSDGANAEKGCSHQHVAKICKSEIRRSKDRMTHTGASHQGNEAWVHCMGRMAHSSCKADYGLHWPSLTKCPNNWACRCFFVFYLRDFFIFFICSIHCSHVNAQEWGISIAGVLIGICFVPPLCAGTTGVCWRITYLRDIRKARGFLTVRSLDPHLILFCLLSS